MCESKLERWQEQLCKEPSIPRPVVKIRKQWSDVRRQKSDVMDAISQLESQVSLTTPFIFVCFFFPGVGLV